jgi:hypothetical protein
VTEKTSTVVCRECGSAITDRRGAVCSRCHTNAWRQRNRERSRATQRRFHERHPYRDRLQNLRIPGLTEEYLEALMLEQKGRCAICTRPPSGDARNTSRLHLDHDHAITYPRAFLCHACNLALGLFQDSPALLRAAADYVEFYRIAKDKEPSDGGASCR